jgi:hypothetical protein
MHGLESEVTSGKILPKLLLLVKKKSLKKNLKWLVDSKLKLTLSCYGSGSFDSLKESIKNQVLLYSS